MLGVFVDFSPYQGVYTVKMYDGHQQWGAQVSDELCLRCRSPQDVVVYIARELANISGISNANIYQLLSRLVRVDRDFRIDAQPGFRFITNRTVWDNSRYEPTHPLTTPPDPNSAIDWQRYYHPEWRGIEQQEPMSEEEWVRIRDTLARNSVAYVHENIAGALGIDSDLLGVHIKQRQEADERSKQTLVEHLEPAQQTDFNTIQSFVCRGNVTGKEYRIHAFQQGNVRREDGTTFCLVQDNVPLCDQLLTQKILIENDETRFLKTANNLGKWGLWNTLT